jgi:predicted nuclease with TOPRIM domain
MARTQQPKDLLSRFADLGEEAMQRLADVPGAHRLVEMTNQSRQRLDEMQKRLRGLDVLEQRVNELEKRLEALEKKPATRKPAAAAKTATTPKKPPA